MGRTILRPAWLVAVGALVVLAGCGGSGHTTAAGAQATQATTDVPTTATTAPIPTTVAATVTTAASATTVPKCTDQTLSANPEDTASNIQATGLSCADAEAFVRAAGVQMRSPNDPARVESGGYVCNRTSLRSGDHGPALATFECVSGPAKVTFQRALVG